MVADLREQIIGTHVPPLKSEAHVLSTNGGGTFSENCKFLFYGCNPIVASPDADLDLVVRKTVEAKLFNSGQDCAGPDAILVHRSIADRFIAMLKTQLSSTKVGNSSINIDRQLNNAK